MPVHYLEKIQNIPAPLPVVWDFFCNPENLSKITPESMNFKILSPQPLPQMFEGQVIEYHVHPLLAIPLYWKTVIKKVVHQERFIDEQEKGPYKLWHHEHVFRTVDGGTEMMDKLHYKLPMGFVGELMHKIMVRQKVVDIFDFREKKIKELFG